MSPALIFLSEMFLGFFFFFKFLSSPNEVDSTHVCYRAAALDRFHKQCVRNVEGRRSLPGRGGKSGPRGF